jgi:hypothetical protein
MAAELEEHRSMRMNWSEAGILSYFVADTDKRRLYD